MVLDIRMGRGFLAIGHNRGQREASTQKDDLPGEVSKRRDMKGEREVFQIRDLNNLVDKKLGHIINDISLTQATKASKLGDEFQPYGLKRTPDSHSPHVTRS